MDDAILREDETLRPPEEHPLDEENVTEAVIEDPTNDKDVEALGWPIAFGKGLRSCKRGSKYCLGHYISYSKLGAQYKTLITS